MQFSGENTLDLTITIAYSCTWAKTSGFTSTYTASLCSFLVLVSSIIYIVLLWIIAVQVLGCASTRDEWGGASWVAGSFYGFHIRRLRRPKIEGHPASVDSHLLVFRTLQ